MSGYGNAVQKQKDTKALLVKLALASAGVFNEFKKPNMTSRQDDVLLALANALAECSEFLKGE